MSLIDDLIDAAASADVAAAEKRAKSLGQHFLNLRAKAAMAGIIDMKQAIEKENELEGTKK